jgi:predicted acyltransferase
MDNRIEAIDYYRGLAIILMVIANYLADVTTIPAWMKHAPDIGLTPIDLIAPFFVFAIGLTYLPSYQRRVQRDGRAKTWGHFLRRWLALIGIGAIISTGEVLVGENTTQVSWGVLQALGTAGILTLACLELPAVWRVVVGLLLLAVYQVLLDSYWLNTVLHSEHGGMLGAIDWSAMMILATAVCEPWQKRTSDEWRVALPSAAALAAGLALSLVAPISKNRVSASYILVSLGASGILFAVIIALAQRLRMRAALLSWWGQNPLLLYVLHYLLLALFVLPAIPWWHVEAPVGLVIGQCVFLLAVLGFIAWLLARGGKRVSL